MTKTSAMGWLRSSSVSQHKVSPVTVARDTDRLTQVDSELTRLGISALPVVDASGAVVGTISRTDLLRAGRTTIVVNGHRRKVLSLPDADVRSFMSRSVEFVDPDVSLLEVAQRMTRQHIHRVFVREGRSPIGVVSTTDIMRAVANTRITTPLSAVMHRSIVSVNAKDPLSLAMERMAVSHHSGVVVLDDGWPIGIFTQTDALAAREAPSDGCVDDWMDTRLICSPMHMPLSIAAHQIVGTRAKRVLAVDDRSVRGIVTGMDFAGLIANEAAAFE